MKLSWKRAFAIAACCTAVPAFGLTIVPTFDTSISGNATDGPAMMAAINAAIGVFESNYADNFRINISFVADTNVGLGESDIAFSMVSYMNYRAALKSRATSANDALALSHLPTTTTDPVIGGTQMVISTPLASLLGLTSQSPDGNIIYFNTNVMYFTRPNPNGNYSDMQSVMEHEIDEVLGGGGAGCNAGVDSHIGATDLFRYATNNRDSTLARTWITTGDNAYFSVDGANLWARFNMIPGADLGDFWGFSQDQDTFLPLHWGPSGVTPRAQIQDSFATPSFFSYPTNFLFFPTTNYYYENTSPDLATNELAMLDVIGWTLAAKAVTQPSPAITFVRSGTKITLSWPTNIAGYALQKSTNLRPGSWANSATGSKTPAVITISNNQEFYRLENTNAKPAFAGPELPVAEAAADQPVIRRIRVGIREPVF
jgi:hypothetical protein